MSLISTHKKWYLNFPHLKGIKSTLNNMYIQLKIGSLFELIIMGCVKKNDRKLSFQLQLNYAIACWKKLAKLAGELGRRVGNSANCCGGRAVELLCCHCSDHTIRTPKGFLLYLCIWVHLKLPGGS